MKKQASPCLTYDITAWKDRISKESVFAVLRANCRQWVFQLERCESTGKLHWQMRIKAKEKIRATGVAKWFPKGSCHVSVTSNENRDNMFYVMKESTRVEGPWSDKDPYVPRLDRDWET